MKFKFPLQKVLEHRKLTENLKQKDFQEATMYLNQENAKLNSMIQQKTMAHESAGQLVKQGGSQGPALTQVHEFLKGQEVLIEKQKMKVQEAEKLVESRREILKQAAQEYKIIEKMRENQFEEYRQKRLQDDQKEMDEQSILRFKAKE
ncbi:flagellar export protein FliJ [Bdellovibrio bacteriovorus]|uniref:Flagellar FliJ protein n=1 Tax=Bdellovibrio bacteriovorus TaxID=959 RepID=A0A150WNX4_BDEBC|nr:flagellar export protein FliJ [Bdellovibrio bacteriovorus]KYG66201.1 flagellar export protein FliJ [Bdellovibrio bacteriovorus]